MSKRRERKRVQWTTNFVGAFKRSNLLLGKTFFSLSLSSVYCVCSCTLFLLLLHLLQFFFSYFIQQKKDRILHLKKKRKKKSNKERKIIIIAVVRESISQHWYSMSTHKKKKGAWRRFGCHQIKKKKKKKDTQTPMNRNTRPHTCVTLYRCARTNQRCYTGSSAHGTSRIFKVTTEAPRVRII